MYPAGDVQKACLVMITLFFWAIGILLSTFGYQKIASDDDIPHFKIAGPVVMVFAVIMTIYISYYHDKTNKELVLVSLEDNQTHGGVGIFRLTPSRHGSRRTSIL